MLWAPVMHCTCSRSGNVHAQLSRLLKCRLQVNEAAEQVYDLVDNNANLIFGAVVDPNMPNGEVCGGTLAWSKAYSSWKSGDGGPCARWQAQALT